MADNVLVLVRHGESEWNKLNLFTGWKDPNLTEKGVEEAHRAGKLLKAEGLKFDIAFTSVLTRAQRTLGFILGELGQPDLKTIKDQALNERDYGELSGLNKDDARKKWGEEQVLIWRRSFDGAPAGRRKPERHGGPYVALLRCQNLARGEGWPQRDRCSPRQFVALDDHATRAPDAGANPQGRAAHRRADHLPAEGRRLGAGQAGTGGVGWVVGSTQGNRSGRWPIHWTH
jgi:broad specificity phosphatase PhoE